MRPKISVIIPAYNEEKLLARCLQSFKEQSYNKEYFEVIIVDNGSTDDTVKVAKSFEVKVYTYTEQQNPSAARRFGITKAKGAVIAFTDADSIVTQQWLTTIDKLIYEQSFVCIGGRVLPDKKSIWINLIFQMYDFFFELSNAIGKPIMGGYNMAMKKEAYDRVGGLDPNLASGDDFDLVARLKELYGFKKVRYIPDLEVYTSIRKHEDPKIYFRYLYAGTVNYINIIWLGKKKTGNSFDVR
jgi:glycosyltransferase involved in cell wall biosynthesis